MFQFVVGLLFHFQRHLTRELKFWLSWIEPGIEPWAEDFIWVSHIALQLASSINFYPTSALFVSLMDCSTRNWNSYSFPVWIRILVKNSNEVERANSCEQNDSRRRNMTSLNRMILLIEHPKQLLNLRCDLWSRNDTTFKPFTIKVSCDLPCDLHLAWKRSTGGRNILPVLLFESQSVLYKCPGQNCYVTCHHVPWLSEIFLRRMKYVGGGVVQ